MLASKFTRSPLSPVTTCEGMVLHTEDSSQFAGLLRTLSASGVRALSQGAFDHGRASPSWTQVCCVVVDLDAVTHPASSILRKIRQHSSCVPVIFTSAKPDLRDVVDTLKAGAFDFFEKPFETAALANRVEAAMIFHRRLLPVLAEIARIEQLVDGLTKRERQLFDLVLAGKTTKEIAFDLGIRDVTVDFHRRNLYRKMGVNNAVNLAIIIENYRHERMRMAGAIPTL